MQLQITKYTQTVSSHRLSSQSISIGRARNNDIVLIDPSISKTHALISSSNNGWTLTDRSRNGTLIDGLPVQKGELEIGNKIQIGPYQLEVTKDVLDEDTLIIQKQDVTQLFSYHQKNQEIVLSNVFLEQVEPIKRKYPISKPMITIGKDPQNDIRVMDDYVSNFHCKIEERDNQFILKDLGSTNGTLINNQKTLEAPLEHRSELKVGKALFAFYCKKEKKKIQAKNETFLDNIISQDESMRKVFSLIETVAPTDAPVFISGETGTGKELVARALVHHSLRTEKPFLSINCGAISKDLIESELFGHEKGAFTSAHQQRLGIFEQANHGTIFLDEIGELPIDLQPKLLRVLETGEIRRVGGHQNIHVDVRIISATHRDLHLEVSRKRFREDLLYRLFVIPVELPPLRDRKGDIPSLIEHFLQLDADRYKTTAKTISKDALEILQDHTWPGNIRELKNIVQRAIILAHGNDEILPDHVQMYAKSQSPDQGNFSGSLAEVEKKVIENTLAKHKWNKTKTSESLGIAKSTLHLKIQQYELIKP